MARNNPDDALTFWRKVIERKVSEKADINTPIVPPKSLLALYSRPPNQQQLNAILRMLPDLKQTRSSSGY